VLVLLGEVLTGFVVIEVGVVEVVEVVELVANGETDGGVEAVVVVLDDFELGFTVNVFTVVHTPALQLVEDEDELAML